MRRPKMMGCFTFAKATGQIAGQFGWFPNRLKLKGIVGCKAQLLKATTQFGKERFDLRIGSEAAGKETQPSNFIGRSAALFVSNQLLKGTMLIINTKVPAGPDV